ncbi:hypothetical protein [Natrinema sp. HArc-T2]|uniref:hypothetical protein n=1 Tax=Natrinema sp. HArc-T2 TaxID=3242701 RepID=UPI00359E8121
MTATTDDYWALTSTNGKHRSLSLMMKNIAEEIRVANAGLDEIAEKYAGNHAAIEAGSNYFTIYDSLDEELDVTLANPVKADWLEYQKQKKDRKDAKNLARFLWLGEVPESYVLPEEQFMSERAYPPNCGRSLFKLGNSGK